MVKIDFSLSGLQIDKLQEVFGTFGSVIHAPGNAVLQNTTDTKMQQLHSHEIFSFVVERIDIVIVSIFASWIYETIKRAKNASNPSDTPIECIITIFEDGRTVVVSGPEKMTKVLSEIQDCGTSPSE